MPPARRHTALGFSVLVLRRPPEAREGARRWLRTTITLDPTYAMGEFRLDVLQANRIVAEFEDEAIIRKLRAGH